LGKIILFPIDYDNGIKYWYLESPYNPNYKVDIKKHLKKYTTYIDFELSISKQEIIYSKLRVPKKDNKILYTIQYFNIVKNIKIRTDLGVHRYPHIDIEIEDQKHTNVYDTDPYDYEASINTILRYAERISNKFVGVLYWLYSLMNYNDKLIYSYISSIKKSLEPFKLNVSLTDISRLVSIELYKIAQKNKILNDTDILELLAHQFMKALEYEQKYKRPLKISKNILPNDICVLPFPMISLDNPISLIVDSFGNVVDNTGFIPTGTVTYPFKGA
jgi:hypothetical protein